MSAHLYFLVIGTIVLAVSSLLLRRGSRRSFDWESYGTEEETALPFEWDSLTSELCAKIFNPEDSDFVASESSGQFARKFRQERTILALRPAFRRCYELGLQKDSMMAGDVTIRARLCVRHGH